MRTSIKILILGLLSGLLLLGFEVQAREDKIQALERGLELADYRLRTMEATLHLTQVLETKESKVRWVKDLTITAYNPTEAQCDEDPMVAASMRTVKPGTVAVSRDLFDAGWVFGKKIRIEGLGIFEINDLMNSRFTNSIDVFMWDQDKAVRFGKRQKTVALLDI